MKIFDTHTHMTDRRFNADRDALLKRTLPEAGVELILDIACDLRSAEGTLALLDGYDYIYGAAGMHPHYAADMNYELAMRLEGYLRHEKMLAVGEIGLDYHYDFSPRQQQLIWFDYQLGVAESHGMPVVLHVREAFGDCMDMLRAHKAGLIKNGGVVHCFSGSRETAFECIDMGLAIGVGGSLTFSNARRLVETVEAIPLDSIVFETDCPYLAPVPHRGERNDPSLIPLVIERAAQLKHISVEEMAHVGFENGLRVLRLKGV